MLRAFTSTIWLLCGILTAAANDGLLTTRGSITAAEAGLILPHEHIFTDLRGPTAAGYGEADPADVIRIMKPLLLEAKNAGVSTLVECTTIGVGRNIPIIAQLARETGVNIVVPTGVYGRANFAPSEYAAMTEDQLAAWMIREITKGIGDTGVRAGFIKTAASENELKHLEEKFLRASIRASKETGVAIASHTTQGKIAVKQADIFETLGVPLSRFVWVHAQAEPDLAIHRQLAQRGVYIELDSVGASDAEDEKILRAVHELIKSGHQNRILLSHDAGWYNPGQPNGGTQRGFTALTASFIPKLKKAGLTDVQVQTLTRENPFKAFSLAR